MKWTEKDWKEFIQGESDEEAAMIMEMVNADPSMKDVVAPPELDENCTNCTN